jgi:transposase InsO family protein
MIDVACSDGARLAPACEMAGISERTVQRYRQSNEIKPDGRKDAARAPANKLSEQERIDIISTANQQKFADLPPSQIVPILADAGEYLASESTFYRVLREKDQLTHRGKAKPAVNNRPEPIQATGPNQLWSWDITYLPTTVKGLYFYLYLILDIYSRKIVGWEVYNEESAEYAARTFRKAYLREGVAGQSLILHSDNGSPMKGATMLGTLQKLGVIPSFSRPSVSNDNAYSEAIFRTLKYNPGYPDKPFNTLEDARQWVAKFSAWYNSTHRHSAIKFVTPAQRHRGEDNNILAKRTVVYELAKAKRPERWSGKCRNWAHIKTVTLNPQKSDHNLRKSSKVAA